MNTNSGSAQPRTRDTAWAGKVQRMTLDNETPKRMKMIIKERDINTVTMKAGDLHTVFHSMRISGMKRR